MFYEEVNAFSVFVWPQGHTPCYAVNNTDWKHYFCLFTWKQGMDRQHERCYSTDPAPRFKSFLVVYFVNICKDTQTTVTSETQECMYVKQCVSLLCCWYLEFGRKGEREEQDECFSPGASPQQPEARQGECRGWETGQQPLENRLPQEKDTLRGEWGGRDGGQRQKEERRGQGRRRGQADGETIRKGRQRWMMGVETWWGTESRGV